MISVLIGLGKIRAPANRMKTPSDALPELSSYSKTFLI